MFHNGLGTLKFVNDLNSLVEYSHSTPTGGVANAYRTNRLCATDGSSSVARVSQVRPAIRRQLQSSRFFMSGPIPLHGFCPTDLSGKPAGYRSLSANDAVPIVPHWNSGQRLPQYLGLCQRNQGLAYLRRFCAGVDWG